VWIRNHTGVSQGEGSLTIPYGKWMHVDVDHPASRMRQVIDVRFDPADALRTDIIHWRSPFSLADGYATAAEQLVLAMLDKGASLYVEPCWFDSHEGLQSETLRKLKEPFPGYCETGICMSTPGEFRYLPTRRRIGFTMYESDDPLKKYPEWRHDCDKVDVLAVPSEYSKWVFGQFFRRKIAVVPLAINSAYCHSRRRERKDVFTFVSYGTLSGRKSPLETIECFQKAFPHEQDVRLVLKTRLGVCGYSYNYVPPISDPRVTVIDIGKDQHDWSAEQLRDWLYSADCMLFLSKGEGFGLPPREALATGMPLIVSDNSGMTDLAPHAYGIRTHHEEDSPIGGKWAIPDWEQAIERMRYVYRHPEDAYDAGMEGAQWVRAHRADGAQALMDLCEDVPMRKPPVVREKASNHEIFYDAVVQAVGDGPVLDLGDGLAHIALAKRGVKVYGMGDAAVEAKIRKAGIEPQLKDLPLTELDCWPRPKAIVAQNVFQDLHPQEIRLIVRHAVPIAPIYFSVPSVHYPRPYSDQSLLAWRRQWDDLLNGYAREVRYYGKRYLMGIIRGFGSSHDPYGMMTRDGVWRAKEGTDD
jgi:hypothetical protein